MPLSKIIGHGGGLEYGGGGGGGLVNPRDTTIIEQLIAVSNRLQVTTENICGTADRLSGSRPSISTQAGTTSISRNILNNPNEPVTSIHGSLSEIFDRLILCENGLNEALNWINSKF